VNEQEILNLGAKIGLALHTDSVKPAQVNKLLEILESEKDVKTAIILLTIFVQRQKSRGYLRDRSAREITNAMLNLINSNPDSKDEARKILGIAKWIHEALEKHRGPVLGEVRDIQSLLNVFVGGRA